MTPRNRGLIGLSAAAFLSFAGCARTGPLHLRLAPEVQRPSKSVVIFLVDGMDYRRFHQLLAQGKLPNLKRRFVDGGITVDYAVTSIPAMTYPNTVSLLTGRFPGHHDIVGNQWFDRHTLARPDYIQADEFLAVNDDVRWPTLYEILSDHFSVSVQGTFLRGATDHVDFRAAEGIGWYLGLNKSVDRLATGSLEDVGLLANRVGRWPSIMLFYLPGVDQTGHQHGSDSVEYGQAMESVDTQLERVVAAMDRAGLAPSTYFALVTDHSHMPTRPQKAVNVIGWLRENRGLRIHQGPIRGTGYAQRYELLKEYDAVVVDGSYRRMALHLRGERGWFERPSSRDIDRILLSDKAMPRLHELMGVGLVCTPASADRVTINSSEGGASVERRKDSGEAQYRLVLVPTQTVPPADPLGYLTKPELRSFVAAGWHGSREWLDATADTKYPDFVPQIIEYFDSTRAGEILIFADEGWAFSEHGRGEHGSALAADMHVPMFFAGPDLPKGGHLHAARLVDVMPTLVDILGESRRLATVPALDGVSLLSELRRSVTLSSP